jgi:hypothetical protein
LSAAEIVIATSDKEPAMNDQHLPFYPLESPEEHTFWPDTRRRVLILPVMDNTQFLAIGVLGNGETAVFIARGTIWEHLGDFVARMKEEGASVEFLREPPAHLTQIWLEYGGDDGYETKSAEPPPDPPPGFQSGDAGVQQLSS